MKFSSVLSAPPAEYAQFRADHPDERGWETFRRNHATAYTVLADALDSHQRGLCAFCEIRLETPARTADRQIEHWRPKSLDRVTPAANFTFSLDNFHMSCTGGTKKPFPAAEPYRTGNPPPGTSLSCGQFKDDDDPEAEACRPYRPSELPLSPAMFTVDSEGFLSPRSDSADFGLDVDRLWATITFLNLNCTRLKLGRAAIYGELDKALLDYVDASSKPTHDGRWDEALELLAREFEVQERGALPVFLTTRRAFVGREFDAVMVPNPNWLVSG